MNMKTLWMLLIVVVFGIQLYIPASLIIKQERTLSHGERVLIECRPFDPFDVFRGRYVQVAPEIGLLSGCNENVDLDMPGGATYYLSMETDSEGIRTQFLYSKCAT
jgi:uncharacterized membrane-anchored protein